MNEKKNAPEQAPENDSLRINYGNGVIVLPGAVLKVFQSAKKSDIYILLNLLTDPDRDIASLAQICAVTPEAVDSAIAFWRGAGVISTAESLGSVSADQQPKPQKNNVSAKSAGLRTVPDYSSTDIAEIVESDRGVALMIDECERAFGKIFRTGETAKLLVLRDYLNLSPDYISSLCSYCARIGRKSVRYLESTALSLYDSGICDVEALEEYIRAAESRAQLESQIRALFGMNMSRELTSREKKFIDAWIGTYGYGVDEIRIAYEITVDRINEPSLNYANAILESWHAKGLATAEQIRTHNEAEAAERGSDTSKSFDSDDFFRAALLRSYAGSGSAPEVPLTRTGTKKKKSDKPNN